MPGQTYQCAACQGTFTSDVEWAVCDACWHSGAPYRFGIDFGASPSVTAFVEVLPPCPVEQAGRALHLAIRDCDLDGPEPASLAVVDVEPEVLPPSQSAEDWYSALMKDMANSPAGRAWAEGVAKHNAIDALPERPALEKPDT
jgi:hypothetical protein